MKKSIRSMVLVAGIAIIAGAASYLVTPKMNPSNLLLDNVEALANDESGPGYMCFAWGPLDCPAGPKVYAIVGGQYSSSSYSTTSFSTTSTSLTTTNLKLTK
ncbi:MAG: NVEALA domain-containing protein [Bacteroidales bacterium]